MSIQVKEWKEEKGCSQCKHSRRIMNDMMRHRGEMHGKYMKKIKEQAKKIEELQR